MINLMDKIDDSLVELGLLPISNVVNNKEKSMQYINNILRQHGNKVAIPFNSSLKQYDYRIKHVLFSFGLGIVLSSFSNLRDRIKKEYTKFGIQQPFVYTWMSVCLYHDFGYFISESHLKTDDIEKIELKYKIFNYNYCNSRYSKELFFHYYKNRYNNQNWEKRNYILSDSEEVGDHGILGGYVLFERLCCSEPDNIFERIPLYQDICFRIMEHNIWRNKNTYEESNPLHEIDAIHFLKIDTVEPLLFLLSLVDTIKMTKKFCKYSDEDKDKVRFIFPKTLGRKIKI